METAEEAQTETDADDHSDGSAETREDDASLYYFCTRLFKSCKNLTSTKAAMETVTGDLESFCTLILKGPNPKKRHDRIEFLLGRAVCREWEARINMFNCMPTQWDCCRQEDCPPDDAFTFCLQLLSSHFNLRTVMQTGRLHVLIGNIAQGPNPVFRQNVLKALASEAFDSHHRSQCELRDCLRETFGMCDRSVDTGQRAH